jgi:hypothetical protein
MSNIKQRFDAVAARKYTTRDGQEKISVDRVRELFNYDHVTGIFIRRIKTGKNTVVGSIVGSRSNGALVTMIDGKNYYLHRLAWIHFYGEFPRKEIDHIDGNPSNNAIDNLRDVCSSINSQNRIHVSRRSSTGLLGAYKYGNGKFCSRISVNGKNVALGVFSNAQEAHDAYVAAKRIHHPGNTL